MTYVIKQADRVVETCREDRHSSGSSRLECASAAGVTIQLNNVEERAHYERERGRWVRYVLAPDPPANVVWPLALTRRLAASDPRAALLQLLPAEHRHAYVLLSPRDEKLIVVPTLGMVRIWQRRVDGEVVELTSLAVGEPQVAFIPPEGELIAADQRVRRTKRLF